jgi:PTS HPr component phosphorylation site
LSTSSVAGTTGGAVCPVREKVQEHNRDLQRRGEFLEVLSANLIRGVRVVLEAIGPDEQEAINELEALLLRFRDDQTIPVTECSGSL